MSWLSWLKKYWNPSQPASVTLGGAPGPRPRKSWPASMPAASPSGRDDRSSTEDIVPAPPGPSYAMTAGNFRLRVGVVSVVGNVREHNEDNFYVPGQASLNNHVPVVTFGGHGKKDDSFSAANTVEIEAARKGGPSRNGPESPAMPALTPGPSGLFIVADGMGGQLAGEKASQMAVEMIPVEVARRLQAGADEKATRRALQDAVAKANEEILALSHIGTEYANMGTTVVLAQFKDDRAYVAGIGDSRAYRLREGRIEQLTRDHSLANALGEAGTIRPEEVETHKFKHVLYLYLGSKDAREGPEEVRVVDARTGDQFLLATDGLMGVVRDEEIAEILARTPDPQAAAQTLVDRALELRSKDNITALVIHLV